MRKATAGFTLIELLVVIAIIGILASVVLASLNSARAKARDATRKAQLQQVNSALAIYFADNGTYHIPGTGSGGQGQGWFIGGSSAYYSVYVAQGLVNEGLIGGIVHDPLVPPTSYSNGSHRQYLRYAAVGGFTVGSCIFAQLENPSAADLATFANAPVTSGVRTTLTNNNMNYANCI